MMLLELAYEIETIAALATLVVDVGARALYLDGTTFETGKIGTALLGLFGVQQRTADGRIGAGLGHVCWGACVGAGRGRQTGFSDRVRSF